LSDFINEEYSFTQFIKDLIPDSNQTKEKMIKGCQIFFPETVFFKDGKVDFITGIDKD